MKSCIELCLSGSMQSYSTSFFTEVRTTEDIPTKSAVIGMIAAAMHIRRDEQDKLQDLNSNLTIYLKHKPTYIGKLRDFQVVKTGGTVEGYPTSSGGHKTALPLIYKDYLVDTSGEENNFVILVSGEEDLIKDVAEALQHPAYPIYLGRKCCIPASPIFNGKVLDGDENISSYLILQ